MKKIDELIQWYENNGTSNYDDLIWANLRLINDLYDAVGNSEDILYIDKIMNTFCEIVETQCCKLSDLQSEMEFMGQNANNLQNFVSVHVPQMGNFENDEQVQKAFAHYLTYQAKKPFSSYTINDYCSRIKILWKSFYDEYKSNALPGEINVMDEKITPENPLLNAYYHIDEIHCYISMKLALDKNNKNLINARTAFNKFDEFKLEVEKMN